MVRDPGLASRLIEMAGAQEDAVAAFFRHALTDGAFAADLLRRVGWHPRQDPAEIWAAADPVPRPVWLAEWPDAERVARRLVDLTDEHLAELRAVLDKHGWPGRTLVGEDGADAAWFLAMHADRDPELQRRAIDVLERAVASGDADPRHLATLIDRVTSADGGEQLYGTLAMLRGRGPLFLVPVSDADDLTHRRAAIGLPPVVDDLAEDAGRGQLPYRHLRQTPLFAWPPDPSEVRR